MGELTIVDRPNKSLDNEAENWIFLNIPLHMLLLSTAKLFQIVQLTFGNFSHGCPLTACLQILSASAVRIIK